MRADTEIMNLIIHTAQTDDRVLAAYLKGSRTNPHAPKDRYRDFDVMYVVKETESFISDPVWLNVFGKVMLRQEQDDDFGYGERFGIRGRYEESYSWLLLFEDGSRIDIGVETVSALEKGSNRNKLFLPLLDKTGCLPECPPPTDEEFYVTPPAAKRYRGCCNEFFWCLCDVVKGIARDELPFAMTTYNMLVRSMLEQMLDWYVGILTGYSVSCGKMNKYFKKYLPAEVYRQYLETYSDSSTGHFWKAIDTACGLFHRTAQFVAEESGFRYPQEDEDGFRKYAEIVKSMQSHQPDEAGKE